METSAFSSGEVIERLIGETESLYSKSFGTLSSLTTVVGEWSKVSFRAWKYEISPGPATCDNEGQNSPFQYIQGGSVPWCSHTRFDRRNCQMYVKSLSVDNLYKILNRFYAAFKANVREASPQWQGLLYVYATLLIPVLFSLLVGLNIWTWNRNRINYQFIFGLWKLSHFRCWP